MQADVRLHLVSGVVVVLELGAQGKGPRGSQPQLILQENAEEILVEGGRDECQRGCVLSRIVRVPVPEPPYDLVALPECKSVLDVQVIGCEVIAQGTRRRQHEAVDQKGRDWLSQVRAIVIGLHAQI
jgi:hypothetical protein